MRRILVLIFIFACLFISAEVDWVYGGNELDDILLIDSFVNSSNFERAIEVLNKARSEDFVVKADELSVFEGNICPVLGKARKLLGQWNSVLKKLKKTKEELKEITELPMVPFKLISKVRGANDLYLCEFALYLRGFAHMLNSLGIGDFDTFVFKSKGYVPVCNKVSLMRLRYIGNQRFANDRGQIFELPVFEEVPGVESREKKLEKEKERLEGEKREVLQSIRRLSYELFSWEKKYINLLWKEVSAFLKKEDLVSFSAVEEGESDFASLTRYWNLNIANVLLTAKISVPIKVSKIDHQRGVVKVVFQNVFPKDVLKKMDLLLEKLEERGVIFSQEFVVKALSSQGAKELFKLSYLLEKDVELPFDPKKEVNRYLLISKTFPDVRKEIGVSSEKVIVLKSFSNFTGERIVPPEKVIEINGKTYYIVKGLFDNPDDFPPGGLPKVEKDYIVITSPLAKGKIEIVGTALLSIEGYGDITRDGIPDLLISDMSCGVSGCYADYYIVTVRCKQLIKIKCSLDLDYMKFEDVNGDGIPELAAWVYVDPLRWEVCHADEQYVRVPVVLMYRSGKFVADPRLSKWFISQRLRELKESIRSANSYGLAAGIWVCYYILGKENRGMNFIKSKFSGEVYKWLLKLIPRAKDGIRKNPYLRDLM